MLCQIRYGKASANLDSDKVVILWPDAASFKGGIEARVRISSLNP